MTSPPEYPPLHAELTNEFAKVILDLDHQANGVRLRIESIRTGRVAYLDPFQLEVLTWISPEVWEPPLATPFGPEQYEEDENGGQPVQSPAAPPPASAEHANGSAHPAGGGARGSTSGPLPGGAGGVASDRMPPPQSPESRDQLRPGNTSNA